MKKSTNSNGEDVRSYDTEAQARQAFHDIHDNNDCASPALEISGGNSDGTGGDYQVRSSKK